ncbi:dynamin family protein [Endozoicomonas sp. SCSIO W0465]|uniref:dynamin family protein n=1 Tax=Endozoicomonas sp. SCSIO W0465 TaxID=2918516 RepID=UPI00207559DC|nr:dynamin family protein [Endozoicomonas sp. SCSIO W0465]USE36564.1 dynamin family protein [Endozoicomonas sp. SCSIO W0465]
MKAIKNCLPQNSDSGQDSDALRKMSEATRRASTVIESELKKLAEMDMVIVVGGMVNAGKSTTINAIVGFELLPEKNIPMTLLPTLIRHKPRQSEPELSIHDPQRINELLERLRILGSDEQASLRSCGEPLQRLILDGRINRSYQGQENVSRTLTSLNDLFSLSSQLGVATPYEHYCRIDHMPTISVEYSILRDQDNSGMRGQLVLMDTPGYNEQRRGSLSGIVREEVYKQLDQASGIIGLMDYTQSDPQQEDTFCEALSRISRQSRCNISAWVNKWDQKNQNSEDENQVKSRLAGKLDGVLTRDNVYPVSARNAFLANTALRELEQNTRLPDGDANPWVKDFYKATYGDSWQRRIKGLTAEDIQEDAEDLLNNSCFQQPIKNMALFDFRTALQ